MRAVVQRVKRAEVTVDSQGIGSIGNGLLVLLGVGANDVEADAVYLADKVAGLRVFPDNEGKMNLALGDVSGEVMVISQFTLYGDVRRSRRPSFIGAAPPERADALYESFVSELKARGVPKVTTGRFQAMMDISLINNGPVTILLDSAKDF